MDQFMAQVEGYLALLGTLVRWVWLTLSEAGEVTTSEVGVVTFIVMVCDHFCMTS